MKIYLSGFCYGVFNVWSVWKNVGMTVKYREICDAVTHHNRNQISTFSFITVYALFNCCKVASKKGPTQKKIAHVLSCHTKLAFFVTTDYLKLRRDTSNSHNCKTPGRHIQQSQLQNSGKTHPTVTTAKRD